METNDNLQIKLDLLKKLQSLQSELINNEIKCWLDFGQLLGAKREGVMIPWDLDIDFGILVGQDENVIPIEKIIAKHLEIKNPIQNYYSPQRNITKYLVNGYMVDFFYCIQKDKFIHFKYAPMGGLDMRSFFFDELDEIELEGFTFKCPRHLELFLKIRYGDDWETPKEESFSYVKTNPGNIHQEKKFHCLTSGVFDLLHDGHIKLFERIKKEFDILTIGIHDDLTVESYKRKPINNEEIRYQLIKDLEIADYIIENCPLVSDEFLLEGYDFVVFGNEQNCEKFYPHKIKNHPISRTPSISTTILIESINA